MKKYIKILFYNILITIILLMLIDPWLANDAVAESSIETNRHIVLREYAPNINTNRIPSADRMSKTDTLLRKNYPVRTDNNGFLIGHDTPLERDSVDMIFFGASTTACLFVEENKRFPYLVGQQLNDTLDKTWTVANGGMGGNHTMHSTLNLLTKGIRLRPKIVVLMHGVNDLVMLTNTGYYGDTPYSRAIIRSRNKRKSKKGVGQRISNFSEACSNLIAPNIYAKLRSAFKSKTPNNTDEWAAHRSQKTYNNYEHLEKQFEQAVLSFIRIARTYDMEVVLMTQFNRLHPEDDFVRSLYNIKNANSTLSYDTFCEYYKGFNDKIRAIASAKNLMLVDLDRLVPANNLYIYDSVHLNDAGSELVANIVSNELLKLNIK